MGPEASGLDGAGMFEKDPWWAVAVVSVDPRASLKSSQSMRMGGDWAWQLKREGSGGTGEAVLILDE